MSSTTAGKCPALDDDNDEYDGDGWVVVPGARKKVCTAPNTGSGDELNDPVAVDGAVAAVDTVVLSCNKPRRANSCVLRRLRSEPSSSKFELLWYDARGGLR